MTEDQMNDTTGMQKIFSAVAAFRSFFATRDDPWRKLAAIYRRELYKQQEENIELLRENTDLRFRITELEVGLTPIDETKMNSARVNSGNSE